jgi:beta-fructofuranosidase
MNDYFYLIGSIREDIKIRYWFANDFFGEYQSFNEDVLLPQGNYAARIVHDGEHLLIFNFFYTNGQIDALRVLPPPKELFADSTGMLVLKSYYRWEMMVIKTIEQSEFALPSQLLKNPTAFFSISEKKCTCTSRSGYELFCFAKPSENFIWEGKLMMEGVGKFGLTSDMDKEGNGYFISFDMSNGYVSIRSWGFNPVNSRHNFIFKEIQSSFFTIKKSKDFNFQLIRYGNYIEFSIDGAVKLTLMDYTFSAGYIGMYTSSSVICLQNSVLKTLPDQVDEYASQQESQKISL